MRSELALWAPLLVWMAVIFSLSTAHFSSRATERYLTGLIDLLPFVTPTAARAVHGAIRQTAHFAEYFVLGALAYRAFRPGRSMSSAMLRAVILSAAYALSDELHQALVPTRTASLADWWTDVAGAVAAQALIAAAQRRRTSQLSGPYRASP